MDAAPDGTTTWAWWFFSVVVVGIIINIISSYAKTPVDKWLDSVSESRRAKSAKTREKQAKMIAMMFVDPEMLPSLYFRVLQSRLWMVMYAVIAMGAMLTLLLTHSPQPRDTNEHQTLVAPLFRFVSLLLFDLNQSESVIGIILRAGTAIGTYAVFVMWLRTIREIHDLSWIIRSYRIMRYKEILEKVDKSEHQALTDKIKKELE